MAIEEIVTKEFGVEVFKNATREATKQIIDCKKLENSCIPSPLIREVQCYNQGKILEFWYYLHEYSDIYNFFETLYFETAGENQLDEVELDLSDEKLCGLAEELRDLKEKLLRLLWEIYKKNHDYIRQFFRIRGKFAERGDLFSPRVVIKVFVDKNKAEIDYLLRDFLPQDTLSLSKPFLIEENTAIEEVFRGQGYRSLINNIPGFYKEKKRRFKNPRLNSDAALDYSLPWHEKIKISFHRWRKEIYVDKGWKDCWKDRDIAPDNSFYKSTMIIPITLINNDIGETFKEILGIATPPNNQKLVRAIYGFLCFDSIYPNFFDKTDEDIGYFFADIFSFYLIPLQMRGIDLASIIYDNDASDLKQSLGRIQ